ncbi:hypothetical protein [Streptomyces kurssanovii]|uniref:Secreted protein n=1 Tax=Streptomyces kurssanovii TaxID=67312 RepID=A0ABV3HXK8_9ACTN
MKKRNILVTAALTVGSLVFAVVPAHAGILDGALGNLQALDHLSLLNSNVNSDTHTTENNNANTRADGLLNNLLG